MANHKSAIKQQRQIIIRTERNTQRKSRVKTFIKKLLAAIATGDNEIARKALSVAQSEIMKAVSKGVYKKNTASRTVKRLATKVKAMAK
jgi:small subunit ribosomal protein S20